MCLVAYQRKRLVAQTDLPVLKLVLLNYNIDNIKIPGLFTTPYEKAVISVPSTVTAIGRYNPVNMEFGGMRRVAVKTGMIHLYRDDIDGLRQLRTFTFNHWADSTMALLRGVIPAGTLFIPGEYGEVCAKTVRYARVEASNTDKDDMRIYRRCEQLLAYYSERHNTDPWDQILNNILLETDAKEIKEEQSCA